VVRLPMEALKKETPGRNHDAGTRAAGLKLPKEIRTARAHGDLSENAEYHAAKERQGHVKRPAQPIAGAAEPAQHDRRVQDLADKVGLGSSWWSWISPRTSRFTYTLVTSEEADVAKGRSRPVPIGRGLLGKEVGDVVKIQIRWMREMEVVKLTTYTTWGAESMTYTRAIGVGCNAVITQIVRALALSRIHPNVLTFTPG